MLKSGPLANIRLPDQVRRRVEVATATASEALMETHAANGLRLVLLLRDFLPFDEAIDRYLDEMNLAGPGQATARTRILVALEEAERTLDPFELDEQEGEGPEGWRRFRPGQVMRGIRARQRRQEEVENLFQLAIAQAEEALIHAHQENALNFVALLDEHMPMERAVEHYIGEIGLSGCRAQTVLQRTMSRIADAQLPPTRTPGPDRGTSVRS